VEFALTFEDNGRAHDDLLLKLGDSVWRCDSYYLALDQGVLAEQEGAPKVRAVLRALLAKWRKAIAALEIGATAYLVYDFSDQCTAWLACELEGGDLLVQHGWSDVEGWSISPSSPPSCLEKPRAFRSDGGPWRVSVDDVLKGIAESLRAAA